MNNFTFYQVTCSKIPPLTYQRGTDVYIDDNALQYYNGNPKKYYCCYHGITRVQEDPDHYTIFADDQYE